MKHGHLSDIGNVRQNNEDYAWSGINKYNNMAGIICDGLGGYKGGSAASEITVGTFCDRFENTDLNSYNEQQISEWLNNLIADARTKIYEHIKKNPKLINMATTLVCAIIVKQKVYVFNVGDSRAWLISPHRDSQQITVDQNLLNHLHKINAPEEMYHTHKDNLYAITQFIGTKNDKRVNPELTVIDAKIGDYIVLTSDGCHNFIQIGDMINALNFESNELQTFCNTVISLALAKQSNDNLSVVVLGI